MKFQRFITDQELPMLTVKASWLSVFGFWLLAFATQICAQRIAVVLPAENSPATVVKEQLSNSLSKIYKVADGDLAKSVFQSARFENPFNLSTEESQNLGSAIGCDYFLLLKSENLRRASFSKPEYYESYLATFVVSSRTGRLVLWSLKNADAEKANEAEQKLFALLGDLVNEIATGVSLAYRNERRETLSNITELPDETSPEAKDFRSPLPYKRLRPAYTSLASLYNVTATVDALVDLDENGKITQIDIIRWAGYGLDESVTKTINEMQWRAASRAGKALPIRVLLRYNFKKVEKEE